MKKLLLISFVCFILFSSCKKDPYNSKLHIEFSNFISGSYYEVSIWDQNGRIIFLPDKHSDNTTVDVVVNKGDVISGFSNIKGVGFIRITYKGTTKFSLGNTGNLDENSFLRMSFTID